MESNIIIPIFTVLLKNGVLNRKYQEKFMLKPLQKKKRMNLKKDGQILVDIQHQKKEFAIVSLDESFFFYDSLVRRVWNVKEKRPVVRITGSHEISCFFGAVSMKDKNQLFRRDDRFNTETFLDYLKRYP